MTRDSVENVAQQEVSSDSDIGGGFIVEPESQPKQKKQLRRSTRRKSKDPAEESNGNIVSVTISDEDDVPVQNGPSTRRTRSRNQSSTKSGVKTEEPYTNGGSSQADSRASANHTKSETLEDEALMDLYEEAVKSLPSRRNTRRKTNGKAKTKKVVDSDTEYEDEAVDKEFVVVSSNDDSEEESKPAAPAKKRRITRNGKEKTGTTKARSKKAKETGPKLTPRQRRTNRIFNYHPELTDVVDRLRSSAVIAGDQVEQPDGMTINLLPFQLEGVDWLKKQEDSIYNGGILADEMGMGKTIQTIGLLMSDLEKSPTLIVAPTVALMQWKSEIDAHTGGKLNVFVFYDQGRKAKAAELSKHHVILTTYSVLESCYRKQNYGFKRKSGLVKEKSALHATHFYRVVLDEAHNIKDRTCNTAKAAFSLITKKKLCLSGTPLQNRIGELYSLIRFLRVEPFCNYYCTACDCKSSEWMFSDYSHCDLCNHRPMQHTNYFNYFILKQIQNEGVDQGEGKESFDYLRLLLDRIMLRRTKVERADDLGLPPRIVEIRRDYFNEEEKDLYASIYSDVNRKFNTYVDQGVVLNNYANIFTLITRMRQMADHPDLILRRGFLGQTNDNVAFVCSLCDDEAEDAIKSRCHHVFCRMCVQEYVDSFDGKEKDLECPVCHVGLSIDLAGPAIEIDEETMKKGSIVNKIKMDGEWRSSTKIEALVEELYKLRSDRQTIKSIVFSQFTSMLDLVEWRLKRAGFETVKLQGNMSPTQRASTIRHFMETPQVEVFLVSLKAGGVALNLCEASQVFILDPWWNPSVEWQSGDRVHRIGQHRPVKITRFCIEDSIESRIIELQYKKADMIHATIGADESAINRLTPADLQFLFNN